MCVQLVLDTLPVFFLVDMGITLPFSFFSPIWSIDISLLATSIACTEHQLGYHSNWLASMLSGQSLIFAWNPNETQVDHVTVRVICIVHPLNWKAKGGLLWENPRFSNGLSVSFLDRLMQEHSDIKRSADPISKYSSVSLKDPSHSCGSKWSFQLIFSGENLIIRFWI